MGEESSRRSLSSRPVPGVARDHVSPCSNTSYYRQSKIKPIHAHRVHAYAQEVRMPGPSLAVSAVTVGRKSADRVEGGRTDDGGKRQSNPTQTRARIRNSPRPEAGLGGSKRARNDQVASISDINQSMRTTGLRTEPKAGDRTPTSAWAGKPLTKQAASNVRRSTPSHRHSARRLKDAS